MIEILLPFYGDPRLLREAVGSVLAQTSDDWRLTVVDDCYPDESVGAWLTSLDDPRVTYHRNDHNLGVNGNFQRCLDLATADRVTFLGCDDRLMPTYVEVLARAAERSSAAMIQPRVVVIDEDGEPVRTLADTVKAALTPGKGAEVLLGGESLAASLLRGNWAYFPAICWSREAMARHGFRPGLDLILDLALILDLLGDGESFLLLADTGVAYRRHGSSASSQGAVDTRRFEEDRRFFADTAERFAAAGWPRAARAARHRLTSRLHAAALLPRAVRTRDRKVARSLVRHVCR